MGRGMADGRAFEEEAALIVALKAGDRSAFERAVVRYSPKMIATARAIAGPAVAEDIVQDAWLTVFKQIERFEGRASLATWLSRIVANRAISHLRAHAREVSPSQDQSDGADADAFDRTGSWAVPPTQWNLDSPDALLEAEGLRDCIEQHLLLMPDNQRSVLVLRDMHGAPFEEICNDLGLSASNVRVLLHRARMGLLKMIDHFEVSGEC